MSRRASYGQRKKKDTAEANMSPKKTAYVPPDPICEYVSPYLVESFLDKYCLAGVLIFFQRKGPFRRGARQHCC